MKNTINNRQRHIAELFSQLATDDEIDAQYTLRHIADEAEAIRTHQQQTEMFPDACDDTAWEQLVGTENARKYPRA